MRKELINYMLAIQEACIQVEGNGNQKFVCSLSIHSSISFKCKFLDTKSTSELYSAQTEFSFLPNVNYIRMKINSSKVQSQQTAQKLRARTKFNFLNSILDFQNNAA